MECLEKALDLEFRKLPDVIDLYEVRTEYGKLLDHYQSLAKAMVVLKIEPPAGFLTKVVTVADRWRRLDQDGSKVCNAVAPILHRLGQGDLYWDYLTTPIALHPGESDAWVKMAESLSVKGRRR